MDGQATSLGLPPALPLATTPLPTNVDQTIQNQATIQWTEVSPANRQWFLNVVTIADIKKDIAERQKAADEALDGFEVSQKLGWYLLHPDFEVYKAISQGIGSSQVVERIIYLNFRVLGSLPHKFIQDEPHNLLRKTILRLIHRLAMLETCRPLHDGMVPSIVAVIDIDNEEVGIQCLKLLLEIVKVARPPANQPAGQLFSNPTLFSFVVKLLRRWAGLPSMADRVYKMASIEIPVKSEGGAVDVGSYAENLVCSVDIMRSSSSSEDSNSHSVVVLPKASNSLKFLTESLYLIMYTQQYLRPKILETYPSFGQDVANLLKVEVKTEQIEQFIQSLADKPLDQSRITGAYHEFMLAYCKVPQLFAYVARHFASNSEQAKLFGYGVVRLLTICPKEIIWGRRDILGAIKIIGSNFVSSSEWRTVLAAHVPQIVDVDFLVGSANGSKDLLKLNAMGAAMEILHFVRGQLSFAVYEQVIDLCIAYFSDRGLGIQVHMTVLRTISTNLSEQILTVAREEQKMEECRMLFIRILNMLSLRLKVMVKYSLPVYKSKAKSAAAQNTVIEPTELTDHSSQVLSEQRAFLRAVIAAVKSFLWCIRECTVSPEKEHNIRPEDLKVLTRFCKYGVQAAELFVVGNAPHAKATPLSGKPSEKDFTEHVADTMKQFPLDVYRDIFQYVFWRFLELFKDDHLQQILSAALNCLLPYPGFSGITTTTMLDTAIPRFPELAEASCDVSSSVLQIFKILFGAVSLYPKEVEQYFKPLVHKIFQQGFHLALRAKDPYNLFLMFRAFFRAMGSGGHEVLYMDFLPNFPMILQILCSFHSQRQKPTFKDIFNELCLIVPVRLSTLMPHISLLAPAILTAMQGQQASVTQGLRTLELSIDNMQTDYLYEQLEPVKKDLMKSLWNIMMTGTNQMQISALRFFGKICGYALKSIREPQQLHPKTGDDELGPCITLAVANGTEPLHVPVYRVVEEAYKTLLEQTVDTTTRNAAWNVVQSYLLGIIRPDTNTQTLENLLHHHSFKQAEKKASYTVIASLNPDAPYAKCTDEKNRLATQTCLQGLMVAAATKDFRNTAMPLLARFVRHFSLMAIVQQHSGFSKSETLGARTAYHPDSIDPFVMLDAIVFVLGQEEVAISKTADAAIMLILETLTAVYEDLKNCVGLPFLSYLFEKLHSLCYDKAWCCKAGALSGIAPLVEHMPVAWTMEMSALMTRALIFVLRDSFQKMTYGIIDVAKKLLERIIRKVVKAPETETLSQEVQHLRQQAIQEIIRELIPNCACIVEDVRKQAVESLTMIAELLNKPLGDVLESHKKLIAEFVPPRGPSGTTLKSYQMAHQTALLEANTFFLTAAPRVVSYDPTKQEDMDLIGEVLEFVVLEDDVLQKRYPCFDVNQYHPLNFLPYRIVAFRFLSGFSHFPSVAATIHEVLFNTLTLGPEDLLDTVAECLKKFVANPNVSEEIVMNYINASKLKLQNVAAWNKDTTDRLCRLQTLYPHLFDDEFANMTFAALRPSLDIASVEQKETPHICDGVKKCALMITLLKRTVKDIPSILPVVLELTAETEETLMTRNGRQLTNALSGFLLGHAGLVVDFFFGDGKILTPKWTGYFEKLLKGKDEFPAELKQALVIDKLPLLLNLVQFPNDTEDNWQSLSVGIRIMYILTKKDPQWLITSSDVIPVLRGVWTNEAFHARLKNIASQHHDTWELSVKFLVLLMVNVRMRCDDFDALFEMTRHANRSIAEGSRWRQFVECHIVQNLSPLNRRQMFLKWLELVKARSFTDEHLAEVCDFIIQPVVKQQLMQPSADQMISDISKPDGNLISIAVQAVLNEDLLYKVQDVLRVSILKLLVLFTEHGENYFPDPKGQQSPLLGRFCLVACTFLQKKEREHIQLDVGTIYQSQNLLAQLSTKYQVPTKYFLTILKSLFAGNMFDPRGSNKAAMDILLPNMLSRGSEGALLCCRYLRRCVTDDITNLTHNSVIFQAIVRHHMPLFQYRHHFISVMLQSVQKLGLSSNTTIDLKRTAVDMLECIVHWEAMKKGVEGDYGESGETVFSPALMKNVPKRRPGTFLPPRDEKPLESRTVDSIANILLRLSFMFGETGATDSLGRRCIKILKFFMRREMYPTAEVKLQWMDKILASVDQNAAAAKTPQDQPVQQPAPNMISSICLALETLTYFIPVLMRSNALNIMQDLSSSLQKVTMCFNARVAKCMNQLISILCATWPGDPALQNLPNQLHSLFVHIIKVIHEGLMEYENVTPGPQVHIFCTLMLLKATMPHVPSILDRFLNLVVNCAKKITDEHLGIKANQQANSQDGFVSAELVVIVLDVIKVPAFFNAPGTSYRQTILGIMMDLITKGSDVRVHRALIRIFDDWLSAAEKQPEPMQLLKTLPKLPKKTKKRKEDEEGPSSSEPFLFDDKKKKKIPKKAMLPEALMPPALPPPPEDTQTVTPKELAGLILKLQMQLERKFLDDAELQSVYTKMVYKIFQTDDGKILDLQHRLLNAYMYGLRHPDPEWRKKFYVLHDRDYPKNLFGRMETLFTGYNWDACSYTNYIGFCVNHILDVATNIDSHIQLHNAKLIFPVASTGSEQASSHSGEASLRERLGGSVDTASESFDTSSPETLDEPPKMKDLSVGMIVEKVHKLNDMVKSTTTRMMLEGVYQLCHTRNQLANDVWGTLVPQMWKVLTGDQRDRLILSFRSYLMTQNHQAQRDLIHFPIQAMFDAMSKCEGIQFKLHPMSVLYLGERQNLWYRSAILLEDMAIPAPLIVPSQKGATKSAQQQGSPTDNEPTSAALHQLCHGVLWVTDESLAKMYNALGEDDFMAAVWQLRGMVTPKSDPQVPRPMVDFKAGLGFERQGMYYDAKDSYEKAMDTFLMETRDKAAPETQFGELQILTERYAEVMKQLNLWPALYNTAISETVNNPCLALEAAWHQDSFDVIPTLLQTAVKQCPPREELNFGFCKAYNSMHKVLKEGLTNPPTAYKDEGVDKLIDCLQQVCIKMWRHLPKTGTMAHRPLIEMASRVGDLKELLGILPTLHAPQTCTVHHIGSLRNMVKNWKIRIPTPADELRFWGEITDLRSQILTHVINLATDVQQACPQAEAIQSLSAFPIMSIHTISQNLFQFSKAARLQQLPRFGIEILSRSVHTLPVVPLVDCYERVRSHAMACLDLFSQTKSDADLQSALEAIDGVTTQYFTKEMNAELASLRGQIAMKMNRPEDGNKLLSAAVQMYENCFDGWLKFGDYYDGLFYKNPGDLQLAKKAVVAYIFGSRSSNDSTARECCAKMVALLNHDDGAGTISAAIEEAGMIIPQSVLVFWVPQLIHLMMRRETAQAACTLLTHVAKMHPQPVYLQVRTNFLLMRAVDRSKDSTGPMGAALSSQPLQEAKTAKNRRRPVRDLPTLSHEEPKSDSEQPGTSDGSTIRASSFVVNCANIMRTVTDAHPTVCNALECFANEILGITMSADRWYEEMLAHLIQALKSCYVLAFENRDKVMQARMTPSMIQYMNTIVRSFGTGVYQEPGSGGTSIPKTFPDIASEAIVRRAQNLQASSDYNKLKKDFVKEFDCSDPDNLKLQAMISKLKKWIRQFEKIIKSHPSYTYLDIHHRPLVNFTNLTAEMELPGDCTIQRNSHVNKVMQILPRMDVVFKHNVVCRRIYFVNNVGETIPYLIIADNANTLQGGKEERILQTFQAMNPILDDFPEASRRALKYYVPKVTPIAPAVRLMEDSQNSVCVWDIYKKYCDKKNIDSDGPIMKFYERIVANMHRNNATITQAVLRDCLKETQIAMVQPRVLRDHFWKLYPNADEYFLFRRTFIRSHAILCMAEHLMRLTKMTPDMMHVHTESGVLGVYSFTFEMDERTGERLGARAVPFRLTPNLTEIFTPYGVQGPFHHSMVAAARALQCNETKFKAFVKTIFFDELTYWMVFRKEMSLSLAFADAIQIADKSDPPSPTKAGSEKIPAEPNVQGLMQRGVHQIFKDLHELTQFSGHDSTALKTIGCAKSPDNLCRMDPSWHPWL